MELTTAQMRREKRRRDKNKIHPDANVITLMNAHIYDMMDAYIFIGDSDFRLVAYHRGLMAWDKVYHTIRGAKMAFIKKFNHRLLDYMVTANFKTDWSPPYQAEDDWLRAKKGEAAGH